LIPRAGHQQCWEKTWRQQNCRGYHLNSVKYLKFRTDDELKKWAFEKDGKFIVKGCKHIVDGKELVFDITSVERVGS
jgi:hypothetical protein